MQAAGESDPIYLALHEGLNRARAQAELRPVEDCITATETFLQMARKRAENDRQEVKKARAASSSAKAKLHQENASIAQELAQLRVAMQELMRERISAATQRQDEWFHKECWQCNVVGGWHLRDGWREGKSPELTGAALVLRNNETLGEMR